MSRRVLLPALLSLLALTAACGGPSRVKRGYPEPPVDEVLAYLASLRDTRRSFSHESVMDYWLKDERVKGTVLVMGRWGARMRFNALNPTGDMVATDLACDGVSYYLKDINNNCAMVGPCTGDAIAQLLRINLEPDDFIAMAVGGTPVIPDATGVLRWDSKTGREVLELTAEGGRTQTIVLDGRGKRWDVLSSVVRDARGNVEWKLENRDFHEVKAADGSVHRLPQKTKFEQPPEKADLLIRWTVHQINVPIEDGLFFIELDPGLPQC